MIRSAVTPLVATLLAGAALAAQQGSRNPVPSTQLSIAAGKQAFDVNCAGCHGNRAQGSVKAGLPISIIQEQGGRQPPDLTDAQWDHGASDAEIFGVIKRGLPPSMMAGYDGRLSDTEIWNIVNYLHALAANPNLEVMPLAPAAASRDPLPRLDLADFVAMPITADPAGDNTQAELSRVNFMRDEPGGRRFLVADLNGPLYLLDKETKQFTKYLDFNGLGDRPGLFRRFTFQRNFATGLINVTLDPDYAHNGIFYTVHMEDPTIDALADPRPGAAPGLDAAGYQTTASVPIPVEPGHRIERENVVIEWTDRDITNATFEGTAREILRVQLASPIHPLGDLTFDPTAKPGDPEWRVMYIGLGDSGSGEQRDIRRMNPQRLDTLSGKILRIVPDLREHVSTSSVSENGRYRVPNDNPFVTMDGARKEIWALGLRNPHRLTWDVDPAQPSAARLLAFNIGLTSWETVVIVRKGANFGYSLREGPQAMTLQGMTPVPADDTIPIRISDTVTRGTMRPTYPVIAYPHSAAGGDAIAGGYVYRGSRVPSLQGRLLFGDITTGHIWFAEMKDVRAADDGDPGTLAPIHEVDAGVRALVEQTFRTRGGHGDALPGTGAVSGRGRVDMRFAADNAGELYILTKSDGMIRQIVGMR